MKKIRIGVLDDFSDYSRENMIMQYSDLCTNKQSKNPSHGIRVVKTIDKYSNSFKEYELYNIFWNNKVTENIETALEKMIKNPVDIIVMSFVINNKSVYNKIEDMCGKLYEKGTIIVAASSNREGFSFPGCLNSVIETGRNFYYSDTIKYDRKRKQVYANVLPEYININDTPYLFSGTSKANAIVAARILGIIEHKEVKANEILIGLEDGDGNSNYLEKKITVCNDMKTCNDVAEFLHDYGYKTNDEEDSKFKNLVNNMEEFGEIVYKVIEYLGLSEYIYKMHYSEFSSLYRLVNFYHDKGNK